MYRPVLINTGKGREVNWREGRGALVYKRGQKYQHIWLYVRSINSIKQHQRRHLGFDVFIVTGILSMLQGMGSGEKMDYEYMSLMAELGEGPPPPQGTVIPFQAGGICFYFMSMGIYVYTKATVPIPLSMLLAVFRIRIRIGFGRSVDGFGIRIRIHESKNDPQK